MAADSGVLQQSNEITASKGVKRMSKVKANAKTGVKHPEMKLYAAMAKIGLFGFGGGSALIPVIEQEVVKNEKLLCQEAYDQDVVVACITPGALPVEVATGIGKRAYGVRGMLLSALLMAAPGAFLTVLILTVLSGTGENVLNLIQALSIGLGAFISSLLIVYALGALSNAGKVSRQALMKSAAVMLLVLVVTCGRNFNGLFGIPENPVFALSTVEVLAAAFFLIFFNSGNAKLWKTMVSLVLTVLYVAVFGKGAWITSTAVKKVVIISMVVLAAAGLAESLRRDFAKGDAAEKFKKEGKAKFTKLARELLGWSVFLVIVTLPAIMISGGSFTYLVRGYVSSLLSFGGGDAYLSVADGMFVSTKTLTEVQFYSHLVPVANVLPGSILCKILTGVGYYFGYNLAGSQLDGVVVAIAGFGVSVAASGMIFCLISWLYQSFEEISVFRSISKWIRPIIGGLLLNVMLSMVRENLKAGTAIGLTGTITVVFTIALIGLNLYLLISKKTANMKLIGLSAAAGLALGIFV